jgi:hypothetical protein
MEEYLSRVNFFVQAKFSWIKPFAWKNIKLCLISFVLAIGLIFSPTVNSSLALRHHRFTGELSPRGNTSANLNSLGKYAHDGTWLYYANPYDHYKLYRMQSDGSEKVKLSDDIPWWINVSSGYLYYVVQRKNDPGIYKLSIDGLEHTQLHTGNIFKLTLVNDSLYYWDREGIWQTNPNGSEFTKIFDRSSLWQHFQIVEDMLFLNAYPLPDITDQTRLMIFSVSLKDTTLITPYKNTNTFKFLVHEDWIYWQNANNRYRKGLERVHTNQVQQEAIPLDEIDYMHIENDVIYFSYTDRKLHIYSMNIDGSNLKQLNTDISLRLHIADGWIYYEKYDLDPFLHGFEHNSPAHYRIRIDGSERMKLP